jgi:hypothetical protein
MEVEIVSMNDPNNNMLRYSSFCCFGLECTLEVQTNWDSRVSCAAVNYSLRSSCLRCLANSYADFNCQFRFRILHKSATFSFYPLFMVEFVLLFSSIVQKSQFSQKKHHGTWSSEKNLMSGMFSTFCRMLQQTDQSLVLLFQISCMCLYIWRLAGANMVPVVLIFSPC